MLLNICFDAVAVSALFRDLHNLEICAIYRSAQFGDLRNCRVIKIAKPLLIIGRGSAHRKSFVSAM